MSEWLNRALFNDQQLHIDILIFRFSLAFVLGCLVGLIYRLTHRRDETYAPSFVSTLVLLSILIAMVTQVIGDQLARAFSLVGALSIVRFRTVVEDTRDTAFVILAVIVGMAVGVAHPEVGLIGLVIAAIAAAVTGPRRPTAAPNQASAFWSMTVRVGVGTSADQLLAPAFRQHLDDVQLLATSTSRQGAALDLTYKVRIRPETTPATLVGDLNRLDGVQSVELRRL